MPYRLTKIYTRKGDDGYTTFGEKRLPKDDFLIEAIGTIDELNSAIGLIVSFQPKNKEVESVLTQVQNDLFDFGGELHLPTHLAITQKKVLYLEQKLDEWNGKLPPLKEFLLPRGNPPSAAAHLARTVCRRAERTLIKLHRQASLSNLQMLSYLNRLSDLLFVISRVLALESSEAEILWKHD